MELTSTLIGLGIAVEGILATCLVLSLFRRAARRENDRLTAALEALAAQLAHDRIQLREQVTALQEEVIGLRSQTRKAAEHPGHLHVLDRVDVLEHRLRRDLQESLPAAPPETGRVLSRLERLDSRMEGLESRFAQEMVGVQRGLASLQSLVDDPKSHLRGHQVDAMVKLAQLLSEITVGVAQGRAPCLEPERIRQGAIAHLHRHGLFLPDEIHRSVETLMAVLLADGEHFYSNPDGNGPVVASDAAYFDNGATIPGDLFHASSPESRQSLRICASALGVLRGIQGHLLAREERPTCATGAH